MPREVEAMSGPAPSEKRRRRNADVYADVQTRVAPTSSRLRGPTLKQALGPMLEMYPDEVRALVGHWWDTWRRSPLAEAFLDTDWQRLVMLAPLVASYYARPHFSKLAEIRQNESLLGATHVDRLKARIKVERPEPAKAQPGVTALDEYRNRLSG
jgi:hypothetical protein